MVYLLNHCQSPNFSLFETDSEVSVTSAQISVFSHVLCLSLFQLPLSVIFNSLQCSFFRVKFLLKSDPVHKPTVGAVQYLRKNKTLLYTFAGT